MPLPTSGSPAAQAGSRGAWRQSAVTWWTALGCGGALWLVALWSVEGGDWFISETHAHILYSALLRFREFPYFSFYLNQGSYLLQDPQFPGLSIITPLVLAFGPEGGLRFAGLVFGVGGCWCAHLWLRRRVSPAAATFGAAAWTLSLGILWRVAVGNDIFLWMLALPLFLLLIEDAILQPTLRAAVALGLVTGLCLLGPTFHAIVYLLTPAGLAWVVVLLASELARGTLRPRLPFVLGLALLVAAAVAAPRLLAWAALSMRRPIEADGTMALGLALESLLSPGKTAPEELLPIVGGATAGGVHMTTYGIWESSAALPHLATLLAFLALPSRAVRRSRAAVLAGLLVLLGLLMTTNQLLWEALRQVAPFMRISRRLLVLSGFGLAVLSAFGYAEVERRLGRWAPAWQALALAAVLASTGAWIRGAMDHGRLAPGQTPMVTHPAAPPGPVPLLGPLTAAKEIAAGTLVGGAFHSVGNPCGGIIRGGIVCSDYNDRAMASPLGAGRRAPVVVRGTTPVEISHTAITLAKLPAGRGVVLSLRAQPLLGYDVEPAGTGVRLLGADEQLTILNPGPHDVPAVRVVARSPVPAWVWFPWGVFLAAAAAFLLAPLGRRLLLDRRGSAAQPAAGACEP